VCDFDLGASSDAMIFEVAATQDRVIISADTDFGTLLALRGEKKPSLILFRRGIDRRPAQQAALLLANLEAIESSLRIGCVVVFDDFRIRMRMLPIGISNG